MPDPQRPRLIDWLLGRRDGDPQHNLLRNDRLAQLLVILVWMLVAAGAVYGIAALLPVVFGISDVLTPFILAFILAYILNPILRFFQRKYDLSRLGVVVITYVLFGGIVLLVFSLLVPLLIEQGLTLMARAKEAAERTRARSAQIEEAAARGEGLAEIRRAITDDEATTATLPSGEVVLVRDDGTTEPLVAPARPSRPPGTREEEGDWLGSVTDATRRGFESLNLSLVRWWDSFSLDVSELSSSLGTMRSAAAATTNVAGRVGAWVGSAVLNLVGLVVLIALVIVICFYMLVDYSSMVETFWSAIPVRHHRRTATILAKIDFSLGGFLRGQLMICLLVGLAWTLWLMIPMGLARYALIIGFVAGLFNFIPYLGPGIGAISASLYVLLSPEYAGTLSKLWGVLLALVGLSVIQAIDGFVLQPKLIGSRAQLHPLLIMLALIAGGQFGLPGLLIAVPVACIARVVWRELVWEGHMARQRAEAGEESRDGLAARALEVFEETQRVLGGGPGAPPAIIQPAAALGGSRGNQGAGGAAKAEAPTRVAPPVGESSAAKPATAESAGAGKPKKEEPTDAKPRHPRARATPAPRRRKPPPPAKP